MRSQQDTTALAMISYPESAINFSKKMTAEFTNHAIWRDREKDENGFPKNMDIETVLADVATHLCYYPNPDIGLLKEALDAGIPFTGVRDSFHGMEPFEQLIPCYSVDAIKLLIENGVPDITNAVPLKDMSLEGRIYFWAYHKYGVKEIEDTEEIEDRD